jgi:hypothetical protein
VTHYERLGVEPTADAGEIRAAYRRVARQHHPDTRGGGAAPEMAAVNEAWRVLRDPARRAVYDASLRPPSRPLPGGAGVPGTSRGGEDLDEPADVVPLPAGARWAIPLPWLFVLGVLALIFVFTAYASSGSGGREVDGLLRTGSCVQVIDGGVAVEVACSERNDGRVVLLPPVRASCPRGTEEYTDRFGSSTVCVQRPAG